MKRLIKFLLLCEGLVFLVDRPALAADAFYINSGTVDYPATTNSVPDIDATNFVNLGNFIIDFITVPTSPSLYETHDTVNYTNTGAMQCNTGFLMDQASSGSNLRTLAGTVNNSGSINCGTSGNFNGFEEFFGSSVSGFEAMATNIINPGTVDVGEGGIMVLTGQNVDLSGSILNMEGPGANSSGSGSFGTNIFDPSTLTGNFSSIPSLINLSQPVIYANQVTANSNSIDRYAFVQDFSPSNISYKVYFGSTNKNLGSGDVNIEWTGIFADPATGLSRTNYLYLNDDYLLGVSTNVMLANGFPDNFTFTTFTTPQITDVTAAPIATAVSFPPGVLTNFYSFGNINLLAGSANTNSVPNGAITNLAGRIEISASKELNLANAQITGANYLSVQSPNQFDGSAGALLEAPYFDINVGVTNGLLTVSNLLESVNPNWSGTIQAWSTQWSLGTTNGTTNDFRVLIVNSDLSPTTLAQVQNLAFHGTNTIISDTFNVMNSASADAQSLTITTNGTGNGASSAEGGLIVNNFNFTWSTAFPNLENLTNDGEIQLASSPQFITTSNSLVITTSTPPMSATGILVEISGYTNVFSGDSVTLGFTSYTFVSKLTNTVANQIAIGSTFSNSLGNLISAINHTAGSGSAYSTSTTANGLATAGPFSTNGFTATALASGPAGNSTPTATTSAALTWGGNITLTGGANASAGSTNSFSTQVWYNNFVNNGLISDQGSSIWADNFFNDGDIFNGQNSFALNSINADLSGGQIIAAGDVSFTADSLIAMGSQIQSGRSLTLQVNSLLTDGVVGGGGNVVNGNLWSVGGAASVGLNLPLKPSVGDLLGTTITDTAPANRKVINTWAGQDFGATTAGFMNNAAIGRLVLNTGSRGQFVFNGVGASNALYVDDLEFTGQVTSVDSHGNPLALTNSANIVIYYAEALSNGVSVAESLNGKNNNHLLWVSSYAGHFSSTNVVVNGTTNYVNYALRISPDIDSNGNGIPNGSDPNPFLTSSGIAFTATLTNFPSPSVRLLWQTVPLATNIIQYTTNLTSPLWTTLTNFSTYYYGTAGVAVTGEYSKGFISPQSSPGPTTNVWVYDTFTNSPQRFYRVVLYTSAP